jgi:uncharacterized protein YbcI
MKKDKYKELVNTILLQFSTNAQMTYSILGKSIVKMAVDIKIEESEEMKSFFKVNKMPFEEIDENLEFYKSLKL